MSNKEGNPPKHTYGYSYARNRSETSFDTTTIAINLRDKVAKYVMNENHVPKKWRYIDAVPAIEYARIIRDCVSGANDIWIGEDHSPAMLETRRMLQLMALMNCGHLEKQLIAIKADCQGATDENMREVSDLLESLLKKISSWSKSDRERTSSAPGNSKQGDNRGAAMFCPFCIGYPL